MIKTGHQFNVNMIDFDVIVGKLRKKVKLANALREYEGTDNPVEAMQGYLDWEFGLVEQLGRDGTHHFRVI